MECNFTNKTLVFFTAEFPYGKGETFIESERPYLEQAFNQMIVVSNNVDGPQTREVSTKTKIIRNAYELPIYDKLIAMRFAFSKRFWVELCYAIFTLKTGLSSALIFTIIFCMQKSYRLRKTIDTLMKENMMGHGDVILYSYWMNDTSYGISEYKRLNPGVKAVCRAHRWDLYVDVQPLKYLPFRREIINQSDKSFIISQEGIDYCKKRYPGLRLGKLELARLGTKFHGLNPQNQGSSIYHIVSCSTLTLPKRVDLIVRALALLPDNLCVTWIHFGDGPLMGEVQKEASRLLSGKSGIEYCFKGNVSNQWLMKYYAQNHVDLFINVSSSEGIPVSIMEAFSCGIPCIATDVGGTMELVEDGVNGILKSKDVTASDLAKTILALINLDVGQYEIMRKAAYNKWGNEFNAEKNYKKFVDSILTL